MVDESLTPEFILCVVKAAGTVWNTGQVAITRNTRIAGEMLVNATESGLVSVGIDTDGLGAVPTLTAVRYCENQAAPDVVTTASHNPPEFNGIKLVGDDGVELAVEGLERIEDHVLAEEFDVIEWNVVGSVRSAETANNDYCEDLLANVNHEKIAAVNLTVALDPGHSAGSLITPDFLHELGCEIRTIDTQPDDHFPDRQSEPVPENLRDFEHFVRTTDTGMGIAHDGDADRAVFVSERGEYISDGTSLAALAAAALEPGDAIVSAVNVSQRLVDVCEGVGADLELTPIGTTNLITCIHGLWHESRNVPVTSERNGGVFYPDCRLVRGGTYTTVKFLELVAECSTSELVAPHEGYYNVHINLEYDEETELTAVLNVTADYIESANTTPSTTDGYRLDYSDTWVLVRPSGAEPEVRVYAGGYSEERATKLAENATDTLRNAVAML